MSVRNDPDQLEAKGQRLTVIAQNLTSAVNGFEDIANSLAACFGDGDIGQIIQAGHEEVLQMASEVYYEAASGISDAGVDLKGFAERWREADSSAASRFRSISGETGARK